MKKYIKYGWWALAVFLLPLLLTGCKKQSSRQLQSSETQSRRNDAGREALRGAGYCRDIFVKAEKGKALNVSLKKDTVKAMAAKLGEKGLTAGDAENSFNTYRGRALVEKLKKAQKNETVNATAYQVSSSGMVTRFGMEFHDGLLDLVISHVDWDREMKPYLSYTESMRVISWKYTKKGWLIIEKSKSKNQEMDMHIMIRLLPEDQKLRSLCRKYLEPIGYSGNNMFIVNWKTDHLKKLNFNDAFDGIYMIDHHKALDDTKYTKGVPAKVFESLLTQYLPVKASQLKKLASYNKKRKTYQWYPQMGHIFPQFYPEPEVVSCKTNTDGTMILRVDAVLQEEGTDCAFSHIVKIKITKNKGVRYLSNHVISSPDNVMPRYQEREKYAQTGQ